MTTPTEARQLLQRVIELERRLDATVDALRVLVEGIEGTPMTENSRASAARAAHQAHDVLLAAGLREPD